jgi:hypothetical protein
MKRKAINILAVTLIALGLAATAVPTFNTTPTFALLKAAPTYALGLLD